MLCRANVKFDLKTGHVSDMDIYCQAGEGSGCRGNPQTALLPWSALPPPLLPAEHTPVPEISKPSGYQKISSLVKNKLQSYLSSTQKANPGLICGPGTLLNPYRNYCHTQCS